MLTRRQLLIGAGTVLAAAAGCRSDKLPQPPGAEEPQPAEPRPFTVALLSDPHTHAESSTLVGAINDKFSRAVADLKPLRPNLWLVCGDVSDHGQPGQFQAFLKIMRGVAKPDQILVTTGNHEFYDNEASDAVALDRFRKAFGQGQPYSSRIVNGIHFVMLADEQFKTAPYAPNWAWLSPGQVQWFRKVLAEHRERPTIVSLHQPLQDTVIWSHGGNDFAGTGQIKELRAIIKENPQIRLWLSGHTHIALTNDGQVVKQGSVTYVGLGSTFYLFVPPGPGDTDLTGGFKKDLSASQSRVLEVWPDRWVIRTRDHVKQAWLDDLTFELKVP